MSTLGASPWEWRRLARRLVPGPPVRYIGLRSTGVTHTLDVTTGPAGSRELVITGTWPFGWTLPAVAGIIEPD